MLRTQSYMATIPNKLSQFWQELKLRGVTRNITVYAAASYVIAELVGERWIVWLN